MAPCREAGIPVQAALRACPVLSGPGGRDSVCGDDACAQPGAPWGLQAEWPCFGMSWAGPCPPATWQLC